jgi:hypothetical protein
MFALLEKCVTSPLNPKSSPWTPTWEKEQWEIAHPDKPYQVPGVLACYLTYDPQNYYPPSQIATMTFNEYGLPVSS